MIPRLTERERMDALEKASEARRMRGSIKRALKAGTLDPVRALGMEDAARIKVRDFIKSLPGAGPVTAEKVMSRFEIAPSRRISGLGPKQMEHLVDWIRKREH